MKQNPQNVLGYFFLHRHMHCDYLFSGKTPLIKQAGPYKCSKAEDPAGQTVETEDAAL
jgi:hypothetical protein